MTIHSAHWGAFHPRVEDGRLVAAEPFAADRDPSELLHSVPGAVHARNRVVRPAVRGVVGNRRGRRGADPFVEVDWDTALDLVADALRSTYDRHGGGVGVRRLLRVVERRAPAPREDPAAPLPRRAPVGTPATSRTTATARRRAAALRRRRRRQRHRGVSRRGRHRRAHRHDPDARRSPGQEPPAGVRGHGRPHRPGRAPAGARRGHADHQRQPGAQRRPGAPRRHLGADPSEQRHRAAPRAHARAGRAAGGSTAPSSTAARSAGRGSRAYVRGETDGVAKTPRWAEAVTGVPAATTQTIADRLAAGRSLVTATWALQRAEHGEQPYWAVIALAACLGPDRAARRRVRVRVRQTAGVGAGRRPFGTARVPRPRNPCDARIPVARLTDLLQRPGRQLRVRRGHAPLPRHPPRLLGGRQPVPPPPGPQPARRGLAAPGHDRGERTVVDADGADGRHRAARHHHPGTRRHRRRLPGALRRRDEAGRGAAGGGAQRPQIFAALAERLGCWKDYTDGQDDDAGAVRDVRAVHAERRPSTATCCPTSPRSGSAATSATTSPPRRRCSPPSAPIPSGDPLAHRVGAHRAVLRDGARLRLRRVSRPPGVAGSRGVVGAAAARRIPDPPAVAPARVPAAQPARHGRGRQRRVEDRGPGAGRAEPADAAGAASSTATSSGSGTTGGRLTRAPSCATTSPRRCAARHRRLVHAPRPGGGRPCCTATPTSSPATSRPPG